MCLYICINLCCSTIPIPPPIPYPCSQLSLSVMNRDIEPAIKLLSLLRDATRAAADMGREALPDSAFRNGDMRYMYRISMQMGERECVYVCMWACG